jgi:PAS domain S-box-containing protein
MTERFLGRGDGAVDEEGLIADVGGKVRILHIEDDRDFSVLVATFLERAREDFVVETVNDPREGLEYLAEADVDCVVCDYDMPGLNGLDVLERVRDQDPKLPFILFTGKGSEEIASEAISRGVTEYLQKGGGSEQYEVLANRIEQSVARYRAERQVTRGFHAIETAHDGISLLNEHGRFIYVNEAYAEITGYDREDLLGQHWSILYPDEQVETVYEEMLSEARESEWKGRTVYKRANGELIDVDHCLTYTADDTLICTITDVSDAEEVREELSVKERAMDEAPIGITITDPGQDDNPIIYANDGFIELTGYPRTEVVGRNCRFLQGEDTREEPVAEMRDAVDNAEPVTVELRNYRYDGEMFWNRVSIAPLLDDDGTPSYYVGFQEDVTERREVQQQYEASIRMVQEMGKVLSHDSKTPLSVLRGRLELARETGDVSHLDDAEKALDRLVELIDELGEVMQTGELVTNRTRVDLGGLVTDVWRMLDVEAASLEVADETPAVYADEQALRRLLENLLRNSLEHGGKDVTVHVGGLSDGTGFYVEDDGPGIPVADRDDVFLPGFTTKDDGTGIGMASVSQIVAAHDWRIQVRGGSDGGTRFEISDVETRDS